MARFRDLYLLSRGPGPLVATALHAGHALRPEVARRLGVSGAARRREEDPHTERLVGLAPTWLVALPSRFELDLNRPRERAVYLEPEDAWGLEVWRRPPPAGLVARSLARWDAFYTAADELIGGIVAREGRALVLDLHAYCHRRAGPDGPEDDPAGNPEVELDTGPLARDRWAPVVEALLAGLRAAGLDARENVRFRGGHFVEHLNRRHAPGCCAIAIELKKTFVDEWTGALDEQRLAVLEDALRGAAARALPAFAGVPLPVREGSGLDHRAGGVLRW
jgi:N-formylglutamate amidohydrolase